MIDHIITFNFFDYLAIFLIFVFGLPHGAFDAAVGISIGMYNNNKRKLIFLGSYLSLSICISFLWFYFSELFLTIFLFASIFHFGLGDIKWEDKLKYYLSGYINGGIVVFGISFFHFKEVSSIYSVLSASD